MPSNPQIDELITSVRQIQGTVCDKECRDNQQTVKLYNQYETAVDDVNTGKQRAKDAKRNFLVASRGLQEYNTIQQHDAEADASFVLQEFDREFYQQYELIRQMDKSTQVQSTAETQLDGVASVYDSQMNALTSVLDDTTNQKEIALRKTSMLQTKYTTANLWIGWMTRVYWFCVLIYALVIFLIGQGFRNKWVWIALVGFVVYPYFLTYTLYTIFYYIE